MGMTLAAVNTMLTTPVLAWFPTLSASTNIKPMPPLTLLLSVTTGAPEPKVSTIEVKLPMALTAGTGLSMVPSLLTMAAFTLFNAPCTALGFVMPTTVHTMGVLPLIDVPALNGTVSTKDALMLAVAAAPAAGCKNITAHPVHDSPAPDSEINSLAPLATAVTGVSVTVIVTPELLLMLLLSVTAGAPAPRLFSTMDTNVPVALVALVS